MHRRILVVALMVAVGVPAVSHAQGGVAGLVTDGRRPLPGVTVTATAEGTAELPRRAVTDGIGRYRIENLDPAWRYTLQFALPGFITISRPNIDVAAAGVTVDVTLSVGPLAETLIVPRLPLDMPGPRLQPAVPGRPCLHDSSEVATEAQRRTEALVAMRLISSVVAGAAADSPRLGMFPTWDALATLPAVAALRNGSGPAAELARRMDWGGAEPLPGWGSATWSPGPMCGSR